VHITLGGFDGHTTLKACRAHTIASVVAKMESPHRHLHSGASSTANRLHPFDDTLDDCSNIPEVHT
jgi:hypothetical protein